jgi:hypothetical protein
MKHRDPSHHPAKNLVKYTTAADGSYTPDLNLVNIFRITATAHNLTIADPTNVRDGQYIRLEVVSAAAKTVNFGTGYHVDGAVIADGTHTGDALVIYEGYYNADTSKWNLIKLGSKAA